MSLVVDLMTNMGIQIEHIPGGCTSLAQPMDIDIGKPLKNHVCNKWTHWIFEQGTDTACFKPPSRKMMADWIVGCLLDMPISLIKKAGGMGNTLIFLYRQT